MTDMACRIVNLHPHPLRIDLRGGEVLFLAHNERSRALREEALYDNHYVAEWERAGWLRRVPARMGEVRAEEQARAAALAAADPAAERAPPRKRSPGPPAAATRKPGGKPGTRKQHQR
ncbi:hypothetical protein [Pseudoxanthomonas suwonensis]|uniref:Uncharacterized protein n=1 Tax=Pseudoxanthomonas suwonensis TaxID=314722 RepID=A0A0E3Z1S2_9GAMM|nr:hypothetical protein [Pseudoxanthomonas suwonensis]AKC86777.1 hypothetical protein WQ53_08410 [Pseudoxanthomonas suwonensis]